jgi:acyl carrier protein
MDTTAKVRQFITTNFYVGDSGALRNDESLLDAGIVDSTGVLEIVGFLESKFGLAIEDTELVPENLDSISRISAFIERKTSAALGSQAGMPALVG